MISKYIGISLVEVQARNENVINNSYILNAKMIIYISVSPKDLELFSFSIIPNSY